MNNNKYNSIKTNIYNKIKNKCHFKNDIYYIKIILILQFVLSKLYTINNLKNYNELYNYELFDEKIKNYNHLTNNNLTNEEKINVYNNKKFAIIRRLGCPDCGFFSFYIVNLGCIFLYLSKGYIPIIDLKSFKNVYNNENTSLNNPWEIFFHQPFNYSLEEVKKYAKKIKYFECNSKYRPSEINIYYNKTIISFWHNLANKYMPIKSSIKREATNIMRQLFNNSKNILGVKIRGTDYLSVKPKNHSKQPKVEQVIEDVKLMDKKYNYDYIFFATEDEKIKQKFVPQFEMKVKLLNPKVIVNYEYKNKYKINLNEKVIGNLDYTKNYILNIIILSKCLDIITSRCSGAAGIFILSEGFRNIKIYNLGLYS